MKKFLMVLAALALVSGGALAGVNQGGVLIVHSPGIAFTSDITDYCDLSPLLLCDDGIVRIDGPDAWVWKVYAAFPGTATPRLAGVNFGVYYDEADPNATTPDYDGLLLLGNKTCGDFEIITATWPKPGSGTGMTWNVAELGNPTECYWFAGYNYSESYSGAPVAETFCVGPHPTQGGKFADDSVPSLLDDITAYGCLGFDTDGTLPCPVAPVEGACCRLDGSCYLVLQAACVTPDVWYGGVCDPNPCPPPVTGACCSPDGLACSLTTQATCLVPNIWHPEWVVCDPNPCPVVPIENSSWGQIKNQYR